ncbi:MAG: SurA N-terminal domain-containing protein [Clostridia bacterium]|jgi:parvulin-like peptidyl-prolyl isomerase|nr:SurA N-terminal domain-containing protein [Clostridia bacterium]
MKKVSALIVCILFLALLLSGCTGANGDNKGDNKGVTTDIGDAVASIDGKLITYEELQSKVKRLAAMYQYNLEAPENAAAVQNLNVQILQSMIDDIILKNHPDLQKFAVSEEEYQEELALIKEQFEDKLAYELFLAERMMTEGDLELYVKDQLLINKIFNDITKEITEPAMDPKEYYDNNLDAFYQTEQRKVRHILVKTQAEAEAVIARLKKGEDFIKLVKELSKDTSSQDNEGLIGPFAKNDLMLVPEFINGAYTLQKEGEYTKTPVQTVHGFHIIKAEEIIPSRQYAYEEVKDMIADRLLLEAKQAGFETFMTELRGETKIIDNLQQVLEKKAAEKVTAAPEASDGEEPAEPETK